MLRFSSVVYCTIQLQYIAFHFFQDFPHYVSSACDPIYSLRLLYGSQRNQQSLTKQAGKLHDLLQLEIFTLLRKILRVLSSLDLMPK